MFSVFSCFSFLEELKIKPRVHLTTNLSPRLVRHVMNDLNLN